MVACLFRDAGFDVAPFATVHQVLSLCPERPPEFVVVGVASALALLGGEGGLAPLSAHAARALLRAAAADRECEVQTRLTDSGAPTGAFGGAQLILSAARWSTRYLPN